MTVKEFYEAVGGDYEGTQKRLMNDMLIKRFLGRFLETTDIGKLRTAIGANDFRAVFTEAHTLKGVAGNLGLTELFNASDELCETCRDKDPDYSLAPYLARVEKAYDEACAGIRTIS